MNYFCAASIFRDGSQYQLLLEMNLASDIFLQWPLEITLFSGAIHNTNNPKNKTKIFLWAIC